MPSGAVKDLESRGYTSPWLAHYEIGRRLAATDPGREEHLKHAIDIFTQLDTAWDLARARETLIQVQPN